MLLQVPISEQHDSDRQVSQVPPLSTAPNPHHPLEEKLPENGHGPGDSVGGGAMTPVPPSPELTPSPASAPPLAGPAPPAPASGEPPAPEAPPLALGAMGLENPPVLPADSPGRQLGGSEKPRHSTASMSLVHCRRSTIWDRSCSRQPPATLSTQSVESPLSPHSVVLSHNALPNEEQGSAFSPLLHDAKSTRNAMGTQTERIFIARATAQRPRDLIGRSRRHRAFRYPHTRSRQMPVP